MADQEQEAPPLPPISPTETIASHLEASTPPSSPTPPLNVHSPDERCPTCRVPFWEAVDSIASIEQHNLIWLGYLPFAKERPFEIPVRLPCNFGHLIGDVCLKWNYTVGESNSCPIDREELFERGTNKRAESQQSKYRRGRISIVEGPSRRIFKENSEWTEEQLIHVNERHVDEWVTRIPGVIIHIACHLTHFPEIKMIEVWQKMKRNIEGLSQDIEESLFPIFPLDKRTDEHWGFERLARGLATEVDLDRDGRWPVWIRILMDERTAKMHRALRGEVLKLARESLDPNAPFCARRV
ncbi:hypothetical protein BDV96DRAFT_652255 [Lophiotrema nucula]|uniref:Uncharacterized protein n=1 Tax=Lophiotrema nucula TaxID=690887 RepID=A0A6A5YPG8_9PLEO|nr:hypothetical protein BDV96DRAFT_652255 [Lophiotrema nucula]